MELRRVFSMLVFSTVGSRTCLVRVERPARAARRPPESFAQIDIDMGNEWAYGPTLLSAGLETEKNANSQYYKNTQ